VDRVFLDANVLFSAAYRKECGLLRLWKLSEVELITSSFAAEEATRNLSTDAGRGRLNELLDKMIVVDEPLSRPALPPGIVLPEKDVPILMAALQASATQLLTGDKRHFGPLFGKSVGGVLILPPATYFGARKASDESTGNPPSN